MCEILEIFVLYLIICILLIFIIAIVSLYYLQKKQIKKLSFDLNILVNVDTNNEIFLDFQNKEITDLAININNILEDNRKIIREYKKNEENYKTTLTCLSHDVRTPLTSLSGYLQMLDKGNLPEVKVQEYIKIVNQRINVLQRLLEQLFEYLRLENNQIELKSEKCSLNMIISESIATLYDKYIEEKINPYIDLPRLPIFIVGDSLALSRVFNNILYNSLIHGEGNNKIKLWKEGSSVKLEFSNDVKDLKSTDISHLFEIFYTKSSDNERKSTGLGLAIAKTYVEKMNGIIYAELNKNIFKIIIEFHNL